MREVWHRRHAVLRFVLPLGRLGQPEFAVIIGGLIAAELGFGLHLVQPLPAYLWFCAMVNRLRDIGGSPAWLLAPLAGPGAVVAFLWLAMVTLDDSTGDNDGSMRAIAFGGMILILISVVLSLGLFNLCLALIPGKPSNRQA